MSKGLEFGVRTQLRLVFGIIIVLSFLSASTGIWRLHELSIDVEALAQRPIVKERLISSWLTNIAVAAKRTAVIVRATDPGLAAFFVEEAREGSESTARLQVQIDRLLDLPEERAAFNQISAARARYVDLRDRVLALKAQGENEKADILFTREFTPAVNAYVDGVARLRTMQHKAIDADVTAMLGNAKRSGATLLATCLATLVFSAAAGIAFARNLFSRLGAEPALAKLVTAEIAAGNLSVQIPVSAGDGASLMAALESMRLGLVRIVGQVRESSGAIGSSVALLSDETRALAERTETQAQALEEIASSVEELTEAICVNAASAERTGRLADDAVQLVRTGGSLVDRLAATMNAVDMSTARISDIVHVIDGIAFQTNILALNAAVEAARVGPAGRGFAVVAADVRALAQRSANAAKEVRGLIDTSSRHVADGATLAGEAEKAMHEVVDNIANLASIVKDIGIASRAQAGGMSEINRAVVQIDDLTQQNAGLVEQSVTATREVDEHAKMLGGQVSVFKLNGLAYSMCALHM